MRPTPLAATTILAAGLLVSGSARATAPAARELPTPPVAVASMPAESTVVGLLAPTPPVPRKLRTAAPPIDPTPPVAVTPVAATGGLGIPETVLAAYRNAELSLQLSAPGCGVSWHLLAGIGKIESDHADRGNTDAAGTTLRPIFGPALDGTLPGNEVIPAAEGGFVRAVGPMQFLPSTWSRYATDGNGDGTADPHNVFDASLAAARYLCADGTDLRDPAARQRAVLRYNYSASYTADVLGWSERYRTGGSPVHVDLATVPSAPILPLDDTAPETPSPAVEAPLMLEPMAPAPTPSPEPVILVSLPVIGAIECGILCGDQPTGTQRPPTEPDPTPGPQITLPLGVSIPLPMPQG
ncbi:lytic murein transglycosylase [Nocardia sp. NPDC060259]|uniref:lytic transglycosylase domain-containing protein n=1 Tax=Nocardia sp. NPDC060259 TaxID=3347088 RepID=UPI00365FF0E1